MSSAWRAAAFALLLTACGDSGRVDYSGPTAGWAHWGNDAGGQRHSPLTQITPANVGGLRIAWTYRIGAVSDQSSSPTPQADASRMLAEGMAPEGMKYPALESTPILAEGRLYLCSSRNRVVALDPETGRELWAHDPQIDMRGSAPAQLPRCDVLRRSAGRQGRGVSRPHHHGHARRPPARARRRHWQAVRGFWRERLASTCARDSAVTVPAITRSARHRSWSATS